MIATDQDRTGHAYERLRDLIVKGLLAPGSRIIESDVAERLGVSRTPIRAALQRLEQEGYIRNEANGQRWRPVVAPLTKEDADELLHLIAQLEGLAARRAALLDQDPHRELIARLRALNQALLDQTAGDVRDPNQYYQLDSRFHRAYVDAAAGPRLLALLDAIKPQAERYVRTYVTVLPDKIETSFQEHCAIIEAIEARDPDDAQAGVEANFRGAAERFGRVIDQIGERGAW